MKPFKFLLTAYICIHIGAAKAQQSSPSFALQIQAMTRENDPFKNVTTLTQLLKDQRLDTLKNAEDIDMMYGIVALSFLKTGNFLQFDAYVEKIRNKFNQTSYLNMAADMLIRENTHPGKAELLAKQTVERYDAYRDDPSARPATFPKPDWDRFIHMAAYPYYFSYARILHANGKYSEALKYLQRALKDIPSAALENTAAELYTQLLIRQGEEELAYRILMERVTIGKTTATMNSLFRELYVQKGGRSADLQTFLDSVQQQYAVTYMKTIARKMIAAVKAPEFLLKDLTGKQVALRELKGRVVVLDFWATWCAPCLASMPAMKEVAQKHPDVVFLYIATQEREPGVQERVRAFMEKHALQFRVLIDSPEAETPGLFPVATAYKLRGIPARVIIDRNGMQRFLSSGYSSDEEISQEMEAMITLAKAQ